MLSYEFDCLFDERVHIAVILDERNHFAEFCKDLLNLPRRAQRSTELECLSCIEELDSNYSLSVVHDSYKLGRSVRTHTHVVLLTLL